MAKVDEQILKVTKEIVVKFIEAGRISPTSVHEVFKNVYQTVQETVRGPEEDPASQDETESETS